jgi:hypothetical protein
MRLLTAVVAGCIGVAAIENAAGAEKADVWSFVFTQDIRYISWSGTRGFPADLSPPPAFAHINTPGHGTQVYAPLSFQMTGKPLNDLKVDVLTRSGYVSSHQSTTGLSGSASTMTDTSVTTTATYYGFNGIQPFVSLALNLPTGKTSLFGVAAFSRMDPDIVEVPTFGEGFNVGPSIGANIPLDENTIFTLTTGYTFRGAFNREGTLANFPAPQVSAHINPSDIFTITPAVGKTIGKLTLQGSFSYSTETANKGDGIPTFQAGDRYNLFGWASYAYSNMVTPSISITLTHTNAQKVADFTGTLIPEVLNSNSNVVQISVDNTSTIDKFSFGPTAGFLHRDHNGYNSLDFSFVPAKTKWSAGAFATYQVNEQAKLSARVQHIWISEPLEADKQFAGGLFLGAPALGSGVPALVDNAWVTSFGGTINF